MWTTFWNILAITKPARAFSVTFYIRMLGTSSIINAYRTKYVDGCSGHNENVVDCNRTLLVTV